MTDPANAGVDGAFRRGAILVVILIGGPALLRPAPQFVREKQR